MEIITFQLFLVPVIAWATTQFLKQFFFVAHGEKITWRTIFSDGGFPSSHSATMAALTTAIFWTEGLNPLFFLAFFVTLIIAKDAFGVRRESGKHARLLKKVVRKLELKDVEHLKLLVGHTKSQVFSGLVWGTIVATLILGHF